MEWAQMVLIGSGVLGALLCIAMVGWGWRIARSLPLLRKVSIDPNRESWPGISIVIAACNEADTVEDAMRSLLRLDYPSLEIVAVNDRSTDQTGEILDRLSADDSRLRVVHNDTLPKGWLGKVHALHIGTQVTTGEWLLYTDADVHFAPGCLHRAITLAEARQLDHVAALPQMLPRTFWIQATLGIFGLFFLLTCRPHRSEDLDIDSYVGVGAFNLLRRSAFERTPGFEWLRLELADDVGLGMMLKREGARGELVFGLGCLAVEWYPTLGSMVRGLEKNSFSVLGFSWLRVGVACTLIALIFLAPVFLLLPPVLPWQISLVVLQLGSLIFMGEKMRQRAGIWWVSTFFFQLAWPIILWTFLRSAWKVTRAGGVTWRGTFYPMNELREGRRLET
jgi:hypothetical protein